MAAGVTEIGSLVYDSPGPSVRRIRKNIHISADGLARVKTTKSLPPGPLFCTRALNVTGSPWATELGPTGVSVTDQLVDASAALPGATARSNNPRTASVDVKRRGDLMNRRGISPS